MSIKLLESLWTAYETKNIAKIYQKNKTFTSKSEFYATLTYECN